MRHGHGVRRRRVQTTGGGQAVLPRERSRTHPRVDEHAPVPDAQEAKRRAHLARAAHRGVLHPHAFPSALRRDTSALSIVSQTRREEQEHRALRATTVAVMAARACRPAVARGLCRLLLCGLRRIRRLGRFLPAPARPCVAHVARRHATQGRARARWKGRFTIVGAGRGCAALKKGDAFVRWAHTGRRSGLIMHARCRGRPHREWGANRPYRRPRSASDAPTSGRSSASPLTATAQIPAATRYIPLACRWS